MTFDVYTTIRVRIKAADQNKAENTVLTLLENAQGDMLDCPAVVQTGVALTADNPKSEIVRKRRNREQN